MRILVLSTKLPYPPRDGGAIATLNLLKGLSSQGFDVTLLTFNTRKHYFPPEKIPAEISEQMEILTVKADAEVSPAGALINLLFSGKPYIAQRFENKTFAHALENLLKKHTYEIIQLEGPYLASCLPLVRKHSNARIVLRAHNIEHEIWNRRWQQEKNPFRRAYFRNLSRRIEKLEGELLQKTDALLPISERDGSLFRDLHPDIPQLVVPTGLEFSSYPAKSIVHTEDLFFLGALDWAPNLEGLKWFLNEVLPRIEASRPELRIHLAGRNAPPSLARMFHHTMLVFHGEIKDAAAFMLEHGIMIVPLFTGSGIRIKILEGMALGKCIITTSIGAEGIPAEDGKHLFIANDAESFTHTILRLLDDPGLAREMSAAAQELVHEKFDTFTIASRLGAFYNTLV